MIAEKIDIGNFWAERKEFENGFRSLTRGDAEAAQFNIDGNSRRIKVSDGKR